MRNPGGTANPVRVRRTRFMPFPPAASRVASVESNGRMDITLLLHKRAEWGGLGSCQFELVTLQECVRANSKKSVRKFPQLQYSKCRYNTPLTRKTGMQVIHEIPEFETALAAERPRLVRLCASLSGN